MQITFPKINTNYIPNIIRNNPAVSCSPLKPLSKDTVSFSGRAQLLSEHMNNAPSRLLCGNVVVTAEPARFYLETVLNKYISQYVDGTNSKSTKKFPVLECKTRIKSPLSIREKVVSKYNKSSISAPRKLSEIVYNEYAKLYTPIHEASKEEVISEIEKLIEGNDSYGRPLAYKNIRFYFGILLQHITKNNYFDFSSASKESKIENNIHVLEAMENCVNSEETPKISPLNVLGIKHYANDIIGARIILRDSHPGNTGVVIDALKRAVMDGALKITSIENNIPAKDKLGYGESVSQYMYATKDQLLSLAKEANAELINNESKSGYLGIHINVDLSHSSFADVNDKFNGYTGEIQIIGHDVAQLKDVEDLCYKLKDNKNAIKAEYEPFKMHFLKYYEGDTKKSFDDYTYEMYLSQRAIRYQHKSATFPSLQIMGYDDVLPPELDFNELKKIKELCDAVIHINELNDSETKKNQSAYQKKFESAIKDAKNKISYVFA